MASKRMFSIDIVGSDAFMDMPIGSQLLYFHLGMESDDDGFIGNPKKVMRSVGCKDDDLKVLISKKFVLVFESGVIVIKHHRINNNWDSYNCKRTVYLEELAMLKVKENKAYTLDNLQGLPVQTEIRLKSDWNQSLEENRIEENRIEEIDTNVATAPISPLKKFQKPKIEEVKAYCDERSNGIDPQAFIDYYESNGWKVGKNSMKDWKASVRTWERNGYSKNKTSTTKTIDLDDPNVMAELNKKYK